mgnify:CR=1 FL=1
MRHMAGLPARIAAALYGLLRAEADLARRAIGTADGRVPVTVVGTGVDTDVFAPVADAVEAEGFVADVVATTTATVPSADPSSTTIISFANATLATQSAMLCASNGASAAASSAAST